MVCGDVVRRGLEWHSPLDISKTADLAAVDALCRLLVAAEAKFGVHCNVNVESLIVAECRDFASSRSWCKIAVVVVDVKERFFPEEQLV